MAPTLKAEFKKIFTVRSTYILMLGFLLLGGFATFYGHGYKDAQTAHFNDPSPVAQASAHLFAASTVAPIASILSVAGAVIALLLLAHEYRYNTIVYTLTSSNSRSKVLASKIMAIACLVFVYSLIAGAILLSLVWAGAAAAGHNLPAQNINLLTFFAKIIFFCEAYAMAGLVFITLIRNQVGAIVALFTLPNTIEGLLTLLLKKNAVYMPFTALTQVIQTPTIPGAIAAHPARDATTGSLSPVKGALVFLAYLVATWIVAWYLFLRRDAS